MLFDCVQCPSLLSYLPPHLTSPLLHFLHLTDHPSDLRSNIITLMKPTLTLQTQLECFSSLSSMYLLFKDIFICIILQLPSTPSPSRLSSLRTLFVCVYINLLSTQQSAYPPMSNVQQECAGRTVWGLKKWMDFTKRPFLPH